MLWTKISYICGPLQFLLLLASAGGETRNETEENTIMANKQAFSNLLYKAISEEHSARKNLIFSPLSLEIILSAVGTGARGITRQQIATAIGMPLERELLRRWYSPILNLSKDDSCTLHVAMHMFVQQDFTLLQNFVDDSVEIFACGVGQVDFISQPEQAISTINAWVEEETKGTIKDLITMDAVSVDTCLVLVNAIYFKGRWATPFKRDFTVRTKFNDGFGQNVDVDMMVTEEKFRYGYAEELKAEILELPYEGGDLSMVIMLPSEDSSLSELERKVAIQDFDLAGLLTNHTEIDTVQVRLPKFKLELTTNLENVLIKLGMVVMFTHDADFSGMSSSPGGLRVSKVVQKAFIEVSEEGTEAAAATAVGILYMSAPTTFYADRPFMFWLWHRTMEIKLFSGCVWLP